MTSAPAPSESTISTIRKLINHEESARKVGSLHEAEAFAARIQEMLLKHNLDMAAIGPQDDGKPKPVQVGEDNVGVGQLGLGNPKGRWPYVTRLAGHVAKAHFCFLILRTYQQQLCLIGEQTNRQIAQSMLMWLLYQMEGMAGEAWKARNKDQHVDPWSFRVSFYGGFIDAIGERYRAERAKEEAVPQTQALVLRPHSEAIRQYVSVQFGRLGASRSKTTARSLDGYRAGLRAGQGVSLSGKVLKS